jgi:hypothetical protein
MIEKSGALVQLQRRANSARAARTPARSSKKTSTFYKKIDSDLRKQLGLVKVDPGSSGAASSAANPARLQPHAHAVRLKLRVRQESVPYALPNKSRAGP